jgi:hypothetical protein
MSAESRKGQRNKGPRLEEATISEEQENIWENLWESHQTGNREANCQIIFRVVENQELDIVEGSAPFEMEEEPTSSFSIRRAGNVGAPATMDRFPPTV